MTYIPPQFDPNKPYTVSKPQTLNQQNTPDQSGSILGNLATGAAKGLGSTLYGADQLIRKIPVLGDALNKYNPDPTQGTKPDFLTPHGGAQSVGFAAEQIGEYFLPIGVEKAAASALIAMPRFAAALKSGGLLAKMGEVGISALKSGADFAIRTAVQTGGNYADTKTAGIVGLISAPILGVGGKIVDSVTKILPERLYSQIFKTAKDDLAMYFKTLAKGKEINPTLAKEMLDRGVFGSAKNMAIYSIKKLDSLEEVVQTLVTKNLPGKTIKVANQKAYVNLLDSISSTFKKGFYNDWAKQASELSVKMERSSGNLLVEDGLKLRRFLDRMRSTSSFRMDAKLGARQAEFKDAANLLRGKLAEIPELKYLMNEERIFIEGFDSLVEYASRKQNSQMLGLIDSLLVSGGVAGGIPALGVIGGEAAYRTIKNPVSFTGIAQGLHKAGKVADKLSNVPKSLIGGATSLLGNQ